METFLLLLILIVMLGALGWLPAVIRVLLISSAVIAGGITLGIWITSKQPPKEDHYDAWFKELNEKIYANSPDKRKAHDNVRR